MCPDEGNELSGISIRNTICWNTGHASVSRNDCADVLATKLSAEKPIEPELFLRHIQEDGNTNYQHFGLRKAREEEISGLKIRKLSLHASFKKIACELCSLVRVNIMKVVKFVIGHCLLRKLCTG